MQNVETNGIKCSLWIEGDKGSENSEGTEGDEWFENIGLGF